MNYVVSFEDHTCPMCGNVISTLKNKIILSGKQISTLKSFWCSGCDTYFYPYYRQKEGSENYIPEPLYLESKILEFKSQYKEETSKDASKNDNDTDLSKDQTVRKEDQCN